MSAIKITRDSGYADRIRAYKVICNTEVIGKISNGETKVFDIPTGECELYLKIDWCRSNKIKITGAKDKQINLYGGSSLRGIKLLFALLYIVILPHKYLWLQSENT